MKIREAKHDCANFAREPRYLPFSYLQRLVCPVCSSSNVDYVIVRQTLLQEPGPCLLIVDR